jgi:hypothetical protein
MKWMFVFLALLPVLSEARVKPKKGQCQAIDLKLVDKEGLEYPLMHYTVVQKIKTCETEMNDRVSHYCNAYVKFKASYQHKDRIPGDFNVSGKVAYNDGTKNNLANFSGTCAEHELSWRAE